MGSKTGASRACVAPAGMVTLVDALEMTDGLGANEVALPGHTTPRVNMAAIGSTTHVNAMVVSAVAGPLSVTTPGAIHCPFPFDVGC